MKPITLPLAELKPALIGLGKVIHKNTTVPILAGVKIERTREGWITLTGTDLDHFVTVRLEQPVDGEPVVLVLPFDELLRTANRCAKDDAITVESGSQEGTVALRYPAGRQFVESRCASLPVQEFPATPRVKGDPVPIKDDLREIIHEAMDCASTDQTRQILNGVYVDVSNPRCNQIVATDSSHLFASNSFTLPLKESLIIPDHKFLAWKGFNSDGEWQLRVSPDGSDAQKQPLQITSRRWRFIAPQYPGKYPDYRRVIPTDFKTTVQLPGEVLDTAFEILNHIPCDPENRNNPVCLKVENRKLIIRERNENDAPWADVEVPGAKVTGDPVTICLNRDFALKALKYGLSKIEIIDELSPLRFSRDGKQMVVMPIKIKDAPVSETQPEAVPTSTTERNNMVANKTAPEPVEAKPSLDTAIEQMEALKESIKGNLASVSNVLGTLKTAQREQKVARREYSALRGTLRSLQSVRI